MNKALLILSIAAISGCSPMQSVDRNPLNISDQQWQSFSSEEKFTALKQQQELDVLKQQADERQRQLHYQQEQRRLALRQQKLLLGEIVECSVNNTQLKSGSEWQPLQASFFELEKGGQKRVTTALIDSIHSESYWASFKENRIRICDSDFSTANCATFAVTTRNLNKGVELQLKVKGFMTADLSCSLPVRLKASRL